MRPAGVCHGEEQVHASRQFVLLIALAVLLIPFFVFQFLYTGYPMAALMMTLSGSVMLSTVMIFRMTGLLWLARDVFLGALLGFVTWEAFYFGTIYSPGTAWFVAVPVVSVLLGGARAGFVWLSIVLTALGGAYFAAPSNQTYLLGQYDVLYAVSVACLVIAIFIFVLMVDAGRERAYRLAKDAGAQMKALAERDDLTGALNRRAFAQELATQLTRAGLNEKTVVMLADLDRFKEVNDAFGHEIGDKLIQIIARSLRACADRHGAVVARLGGDEFAILIRSFEAEVTASSVARELLNLIADPFDIDGRQATVGISIGIALANAASCPSELLRQADIAMYEAKARGKNRYCWHQEILDQNRNRRLRLARELRHALENQQIKVHYQPVVDAGSREIVAVEALARWTRLNGSAVPPDEFIPVAEESGQIDRLGLLVLRTACAEVRTWGDIKLCVNLSPLQFRSPSLLEDILRTLSETGLPAGRLELEVTEHYLIEHKDRAQPLLASLREAGVSIALDDFGAGYSSIGYLRQYAFDRLKIDRSLVRGLVNDPSARGIIQATAVLAKSLDLALTAEGVETEEEARLLGSAGCDNLQGYHFGRPQEADEIRNLLKPKLRSVSAA